MSKSQVRVNFFYFFSSKQGHTIEADTETETKIQLAMPVL